jgi:hypothetical protein
MFKFMITFVSCFTTGKVHKLGDITKMNGQTNWLSLCRRPLFLGMPSTLGFYPTMNLPIQLKSQILDLKPTIL